MSATLFCSDVGRAVEFYKTVAGMQVETAPEATVDLHVPHTLSTVGLSEVAAPVLMVNSRHIANAGLLLVPAALARAAFGVAAAPGSSGGSEGLEAGAAAAASAALEEWCGAQVKARQVRADATTSTLHALLSSEGEAEGRASTVLTFDLTAEPGCEPGTAAGVTVHRSHRAAAALGMPATEVEATGSAGGPEKLAFTCFDPDGHAVYITGPAE
jgi:catechol 2,3-dioxygenase-like lactoylglutathione lyase family enzyme